MTEKCEEEIPILKHKFNFQLKGFHNKEQHQIYFLTRLDDNGDHV
jgi:hypothetical protein